MAFFRGFWRGGTASPANPTPYIPNSPIACDWGFFSNPEWILWKNCPPSCLKYPLHIWERPRNMHRRCCLTFFPHKRNIPLPAALPSMTCRQDLSCHRALWKIMFGGKDIAGSYFIVALYSRGGIPPSPICCSYLSEHALLGCHSTVTGRDISSEAAETNIWFGWLPCRCLIITAVQRLLIISPQFVYILL